MGLGKSSGTSHGFHRWSDANDHRNRFRQMAGNAFTAGKDEYGDHDDREGTQYVDSQRRARGGGVVRFRPVKMMRQAGQKAVRTQTTSIDTLEEYLKTQKALLTGAPAA